MDGRSEKLSEVILISAEYCSKYFALSSLNFLVDFFLHCALKYLPF